MGRDLHTPLRVFFLACFLGSLVLLLRLLFPYLSILVLGAVFSGICYPWYRYIQKPPWIGPSSAALVTCLALFILLSAAAFLFIGSLTRQAFGLYQMARGAHFGDQIILLLQDNRIPESINALLAGFDYVVTGEEIKNLVAEILKWVGLFVYDQARAVASNTLAFFAKFCLMLLVVYFFLLDGPRLFAYLVDLSPLPKEQVHTLTGKFKEMARILLIVNGLAGLAQGVLIGLLFWFTGFQLAFLLGVAAGLFAFLPIVGIGSVLVPAALYLLIKGKIGLSIFFVIYYVVAAGAENLLKPKMVGQQAKMHLLLVFFASIGGLKMFGVLGMIYGPLVVTAFLTLADIYRAGYQRTVESQERYSSRLH